MNSRTKRLAPGTVQTLQAEFGVGSSRRIRRIVESGGVGLGIGTTDAMIYEFLWQHRHEVFTRFYYPTFCQNDKIHL